MRRVGSLRAGRGWDGGDPAWWTGGYGLTVRVRQHAYFALYSERMSAAEMSGWSLDARVLGFLVAVGADLDVDEYG